MMSFTVHTAYMSTHGRDIKAVWRTIQGKASWVVCVNMRQSELGAGKFLINSIQVTVIILKSMNFNSTAS